MAMLCERVRHVKRPDKPRWLWYKQCRRKAVGRFRIPDKEGFVHLCPRCVEYVKAEPMPASVISTPAPARKASRKRKRR